MSPRTVLYGLRNTRKQATDQQCPRPRPHTTAHWHRMHTSCDRQAAARIPIAFAPGTPALAFPAVSSPEACATPALRPWVIVVWVPVPGRYPTTLNKFCPTVMGARGPECDLSSTLAEWSGAPGIRSTLSGLNLELVFKAFLEKTVRRRGTLRSANNNLGFPQGL